MSNTLVFNTSDWVPAPPVIDGLVLADIGVTAPESEPGYINGARIELGSSGLAPVVINAVEDRTNGTLVIGFMCRGDTSFDKVDMVMLALRGPSGEQRRIDIKPNWGDEPTPLPTIPPDTPQMVSDFVTAIGYGAANPDPANPGTHLLEPASPLGFDIRTNKPAQAGPTFYRRAGPSGSWNVSTSPTGFECKVRSWQPSVVMGSPVECAWSVELRIPISVATGGADWLDLGDDFGVFIDVFRAFRASDADGALVGWTQYTFPSSAPPLTGIIGTTTDIPAASFGRGLKGAMVSQGQGVRIKGGSAGIGNRPDGSLTLTNLINASPAAPPPPPLPTNHIIAQLENTGPAASGIVAEVRMRKWGLTPADFLLWELAAGCTNPSLPVALAAGTPGTPSPVVETDNPWPSNSVPSDYLAHPHRCMWVQLTGTGSPVVFTQGSARRNMDFVGLSEEKRDAEISAEGYPKPGDGSDHQEFMLRTRCRKIVVSELIGAKSLSEETMTIVGGALQYANERGMIIRGQVEGTTTHATLATTGRRAADIYKDSVVYLWITEGLRRTHQTMEIDGIKGEIWDNGPGDFSLAAYHNGVNDPMGWQLSGPGLIKRGDGVYGIKVKDGQTATIGIKVGAGPEIKPGDSSKLPTRFADQQPGPDIDPGPGGCFKQALIVLVAIPTALYAIGQMIV